MAVDLPDLNEIDPLHIEQIEEILRQETRDAATDQEALEIVRRIYDETVAGMTYDEEGVPVNLLMTGADDWSDEQIEAHSRVYSNADGRQKKKREAIVYGIGSLLAVVLLVYYGFLGGAGRKARTSATALEAGDVGTGTPEPGLAERQDALELADGLGGRIRLGVPRTLEVMPADSERSYTLAVMVAPVDDDGILPIADEILDGELVTEWIDGTYINFSFGMPPWVLRELDAGAQAIIRTTTGATYHFSCSAPLTFAPQEVESIFDQKRPGLTLFPLPSPSNDVAVQRCAYDPTQEDVSASAVTAGLSQTVQVDNVTIAAESVVVNQMADGQLRYEVRGRISATSGSGVVLMSLASTAGQQSPVGEEYLAMTEESEWLAEFILPPAFTGTSAVLTIRNPLGSSAHVELGSVPDHRAALRVSLDERQVYWDGDEVELVARIDNHADGAARITEQDFTAYQQGGDVQIRFIGEGVPVVVPGKQSMQLVLRLTPTGGDALSLQVLNTLWEVQGLPVVNQ